SSAVVRVLAPADLDPLALAPRTIPPFDPDDGRALLAAALAAGGRVVAGVAGSTIVGVAVAAPAAAGSGDESLLALGVAPAWRRAGLAGALLGALVAGRPAGAAMEARIGVAERDVVEPLPVETRIAVGRRLLEGAGFAIRPVPPDVARDDRWAVAGRLERA
ncbi:MAG: hypothetical protein AB1627_14615, partial [Chloroflexota bacterium]